jgi:hypothetical protein
MVGHVTSDAVVRLALLSLTPIALVYETKGHEVVHHVDLDTFAAPKRKARSKAKK